MSNDPGADWSDSSQPDPLQTDGHQDVGDQEEVIPEPQVDPGAADLSDADDFPEDTTSEAGERDADDAPA
jgi:hypothetical protein